MSCIYRGKRGEGHRKADGQSLTQPLPLQMPFSAGRATRRHLSRLSSQHPQHRPRPPADPELPLLRCWAGSGPAARSQARSVQLGPAAGKLPSTSLQRGRSVDGGAVGTRETEEPGPRAQEASLLSPDPVRAVVPALRSPKGGPAAPTLPPEPELRKPGSNAQ